MASAFKTLYEGELPALVGVLATVPALSSWIIKHISLVNHDRFLTHTCALYRNGTTDAQLMTPPDMTILPGGMEEFTGTLTLEAGGTIAGVADIAAAIVIIIDGDQVT